MVGQKQDEIDQLAQEIQGLQEGMVQAAQPRPVSPQQVVAPVAEAAAPVVEAAAPVVEAAAPVVEAAAPVAEAVAPVAEAVAPVVEAVEATADAQDPMMSEFQAPQGAEGSMEESLSDIPNESSDSKGILDAEAEELAQMVDESLEISKNAGGGGAMTASMEKEGTLTLSLSGSMKLRLQYEFEGQAIVVGFEDGFLRVELADGTEFKIPLGSRVQKAA